jgi:squalene synthase HpnC
LCRAHYENFPVASRFIPKDKRGAIAAVYAFARRADDFADEGALEPAERLRLLADWRERLRACASDHRQHPVFWALADTIVRYGLPLEPFEKLITAFEMDVTKNRHKTFEDLLYYCRHSANPVGELVLRIFGEWTDQRGRWSDDICTALQLANFWQDVTVDANKDRIYVPQQDMDTFEIGEEGVMYGPATRASRELIAMQTDRTWALFLSGRPLCDDVSPALRKELRLVWLGGTSILEKIDAAQWDVWSRRPKLNFRDWAGLFGRWLFWRRTPLPLGHGTGLSDGAA